MYLLHFIKSQTGPSFPTSNLFAGQMVTGNSGSVIAVAGNNAVLELSEGSTQWNKLKVYKIFMKFKIRSKNSLNTN